MGLDFEGIILDPAKHPSNPSPEDVWEITPEDIRKMEVALDDHIHHAKALRATRIPAELRNYKRRYLAVLDGDGEKIVEIFCAHKSVIDRDYWLKNYFEPDGGGQNYWHITYDLFSRSFTDFYVNPSD